ncbi:MAG: translocation/assembly module TamB, partial [Treponema sp.]|nr:translocation/assembly module TamB [Treponema sp.]
SQVSVNNLFVDSMLYDAAFFLSASSGKSLSAAAKNLSPYIMSSDLYLSSDFHSFSFNAPFFILANTQNDHELLMFAADGSNQTVQLSNFELQFGSMSASANIQADFDRGFDDFTFFGSATVNALPYSFNGNYARRWLSVSGDYGFEAVLSLADEVTGSVRFSQLPVAAGKNVFAFSTESSFSWSEETGPTAELYSFSMEDASGASSLNPRMTVSGSMNHNSFVFSSLSYSDSVSELDGSGNILWNVNNGIFDSIHIDFDARSPLYSEQISLAADFVNPTQVPFSAAALQNDFYVSVQAKLTAFPLGRLLREQGSDNVLTATATVTGTVANPFVTMQVEHAALSLNGSPLLAHGTFSLDDTGVHIAGISGSWRNMKLSDLSADFNLTTMNGHAGCVFEGDVLGQGFTVPLEVSMESLPSEDSRLLKDFTLTASSKKVSGALFPKPFPFELTLIHSQDRYDLFSNGGFTASLLSDGTVYAKTSDASKLTFELNGNVSKNGMNLEFSRVRADLAHISSNFYFEWVQFTAGLLTGSFRVKGLLSDPEFGGELTVSNPVFTIPFVSEQAFKGKLVVAAFSESTMNVDPTRFECGRGLLDAGVRIDFDRWGLEQLAVTLNGVEDKLVPVDMTFPLVHYKGNALVNLGLTLTSTDFSVTGSIFGQNGDINIQTSSWQSFLSGDNLALSGLFTKKEESAPLPFDFSCDLRVIAGNKVQILYDPFLRGLIVPGTVLNFGLSTGTGDFSLKGDIALRGGEIIWLNRNFYMKEGRIVFNENQDILDPRLTVRAETRERDSGGNAVTISLSASSQPVSRFNPRLSASPAKSEAEIMELLGQVVSADSDSIGSVAMAGGDYLVNAMVMRRIETALRDLTNFDIFSVRTMVLQNAVSQSTRSNSSENSTTFGNFFDNSAVYIGKYFGSSVYVDALMQWTYDETKSVDNGDVSSLVFHPEFGFEMSSPFVNIRWGIAPDVEALQTRKPWFVPSASITLSWKISF